MGAKQFQHAQRMEQQLAIVQEQASRFMVQNQKLTQQLTDFQKERSALDERVFSLGVQLSAAASELQRTNARLAESQGLSNQLNQVQAELDRQMASARDERQAAQAQIEHLTQEKSDLARSLTHVRQRLALLERDYQDVVAALTEAKTLPNPNVHLVSTTGPLRTTTASSADLQAPAALRPDTVELPPVLIAPHPVRMATPVRGRLVDVNAPHHFVVIDKGSLNGVHEGMVFDVLRGETPVGQATAVRVHPQLSACNILPVSASTSFREGDAAVQRRP